MGCHAAVRPALCHARAMQSSLILFPIAPVLGALDVAGSSVFVGSGALTATRKWLDIVGACSFPSQLRCGDPRG